MEDDSLDRQSISPPLLLSCDLQPGRHHTSTNSDLIQVSRSLLLGLLFICNLVAKELKPVLLNICTYLKIKSCLCVCLSDEYK